MNKNSQVSWITGIIVVAVIAIIALVGISRPKSSSTITVGVILPLTGQYSTLGEDVQKAMELSAKDISPNKVKLIFEDDQYDAKDGLSAYHKLVDVDHADMVISFGSPTVEIVKPEIAKTNKLMFILGDELSHDIDNTFQLMPQGAGIFSALGQEAGKRYQSVSIVYASDNSLFEKNRESFKTGLPAGMMIKEFAVTSASDMKTEAAKIASSGSDAYTIFVPLETGVKLLKELAIYKAKPHLICDMDVELSATQYIAAIGATPFEGCISVAMANTQTANFVSLYKQTYASDPQFGSDYGYDAVQIIAKLADMPQASWQEYLNSSFSYTGMSGVISFDSTGTRPALSELHIFKNGAFTKVTD